MAEDKARKKRIKLLVPDNKVKLVDTTTTISLLGRAHRDAETHDYVYGDKSRSRLASTIKTPNDINLMDIQKLYNLKGFEFGNWLSNEDRYDNVLAADKSLDFLRWMFNSDNIGINGMIGIAFGARGFGGAAAHYEPFTNMINLTKNWGAGSLAHEYGHALDYVLGRYYDQNKSHSALSGGRKSFRTPLYDNVGGQLRYYVNYIVDYPSTLPRLSSVKRWEDYWGRRTEVFARLFEQYVGYRLNKAGQSNKYLAKPVYRYETESVYLHHDEFKPLMKVFDKLVKEISLCLNSKGNVKVIKPMPYHIQEPVKVAEPKGTTKTSIPKIAADKKKSLSAFMFKNIPVIDSLRKKYRPDLINWMLYYNKYYHQHYSKIKKLLSGSDEKALLQIIQQHFDSGIVKKENYEKPVNYGEYLKNKIEKAEKGHPDFELTQRNLYVIEDIADQNVEDLFLDDMIKLWKSLAKDKSVKKAPKKSVKKAPVQGSLFTMQKKKTTPSKKTTLKSTKKTALLSLIPRKKK